MEVWEPKLHFYPSAGGLKIIIITYQVFHHIIRIRNKTKQNQTKIISHSKQPQQVAVGVAQDRVYLLVGLVWVPPARYPP